MTKKTKKSAELQPATVEAAATPETKIADPIGDVTDGEAAAAIEPPIEATAEAEPASDEAEDSESEAKPRPPAKLERLQKILAQAGVASRRKAEEMIEQGRVQVNGKIVTVLGTKADAGRDHIRVDGKLLQGSERLRYFVLNKPRGFVTTVKDPEGRPTVMQFFAKINERLYPVGRLDYMSEGLLVVTNDGELANRLTRAAAGVEKTYLVKVAGQPTEAELDILRGGVSIERGKPGSPQVRTSPARIRQVRQGDNPWYEVILIEGRNRELRKMFEEVGHFVEKIRRVGYGPLVLDQEPGNLRELEPEELAALRAVAEGKLRTPKSKELRRRNAMDAAGLPTVAPRPTVHPRPAKPFVKKSFEERPASGPGSGPRDYQPQKSFGSGRPARPSTGDYRPARPAWKKDDRPSTGKPFADRPAAGRTFESKPAASRSYGAKPGPGKPYADRPAAARTYGAKPYAAKPYGDKPSTGRFSPAKPAWKKPESHDRPPYKRPPASRSAAPRHDDDEPVNLGPKTPSRLFIEPIEHSDRPTSERPGTPRPSAPRSRPDRPYADRSGSGRPGAGSSGSGRSSSARPFRSEGGLARPYTTSSGKPRAGGARPSSKPGKPASGRSYGAGPKRDSGPRTIDPRTGSAYRPAAGPKRSFDGPPTGFKRPGAGPRPSGSSRPFTPREGSASESRPRSSKPYSNSAPRADRNAGPGWKPKTRYGGSGKPASGGGSKPGGFSKSAYKGKPSGPKRSGAPGGKKRR